MDIGNVIAEQAGTLIAEKIVNGKTKDNVFTRTFNMVKLLLSDPEKADAHVFVQNGEIVAVITPDKEDLKTGKKTRQIVLKVKTREVGDGDK